MLSKVHPKAPLSLMSRVSPRRRQSKGSVVVDSPKIVHDPSKGPVAVATPKISHAAVHPKAPSSMVLQQYFAPHPQAPLTSNRHIQQLQRHRWRRMLLVQKLRHRCPLSSLEPSSYVSFRIKFPNVCQSSRSGFMVHVELMFRTSRTGSMLIQVDFVVDAGVAFSRCSCIDCSCCSFW